MIRAQWGVADPEQLAALGKLSDEYAKEMGISGDREARDRLAERIWTLFNEGVAGLEEIRRRLDSSRARLSNGPAAGGRVWLGFDRRA
ncbi:hypothetical protein GCM10007880_17010 [Mesorhizobium amorphae]|uniref:Uncharacterized protein n=1 Tax=Mesorhizobium amorphae CCNWGS0123 TaxID=1082933 RepID=G6YDH6_9HYPH|nr:hypothetical protein A6B35_27095 [Mesorhizobium amorphae CCNWGS0123]EHH10276.1 hypothetical protein MEA186_20067 [Mesorhizobium amorphae CCNWGS0123]GLR41185.1 hypothetical protein GCM10007880_17010 [Mesorhizobium amorphae]